MPNEQQNAESNLRIAGQTQRVNSVPKQELAIVSPCSTCNNFAQSGSSSTPIPYVTPCPRRNWIQQNQYFPETIDPVLYLSGTSNPNTLVNPVIDSTTSNYLVWIAALEDNTGVTDSNGNVLTPGILDPNFNNLYIVCRGYPYISEHRHDVLRNLGAFQEGDRVNATQHRVPSLNPTVTMNNNQVFYTETPVAGTVSKNSPAYAFNTTNADDHAIVPS